MTQFRNPNFEMETTSIHHHVQMILRDFWKLGRLAVLGGGALRDTFLGRPIKDFDIFVNAQDADDYFVMDLLRSHGFSSRVLVTNEAVEYLQFTDVSSVLEAVHPRMPLPLQIIRMHANNESAERMIERLDFGPCQIGMDGLGYFWVTEQFEKDIKAHQFTATRLAAKDVMRSIKRFERLKEKYKGWKLVLP